MIEKIKMPDKLDWALEGLVRAVLQHQPEDIYLFAAQHFEQIVQSREKDLGGFNKDVDHLAEQTKILRAEIPIDQSNINIFETVDLPDKNKDNMVAETMVIQPEMLNKEAVLSSPLQIHNQLQTSSDYDDTVTSDGVYENLPIGDTDEYVELQIGSNNSDLNNVIETKEPISENDEKMPKPDEEDNAPENIENKDNYKDLDNLETESSVEVNDNNESEIDNQPSEDLKIDLVPNEDESDVIQSDIQEAQSMEIINDDSLNIQGTVELKDDSDVNISENVQDQSDISNNDDQKNTIADENIEKELQDQVEVSPVEENTDNDIQALGELSPAYEEPIEDKNQVSEEPASGVEENPEDNVNELPANSSLAAEETTDNDIQDLAELSPVTDNVDRDNNDLPDAPSNTNNDDPIENIQDVAETTVVLEDSDLTENETVDPIESLSSKQEQISNEDQDTVDSVNSLDQASPGPEEVITSNVTTPIGAEDTLTREANIEDNDKFDVLQTEDLIDGGDLDVGNQTESNELLEENDDNSQDIKTDVEDVASLKDNVLDPEVIDIDNQTEKSQQEQAEVEELQTEEVQEPLQIEQSLMDDPNDTVEELTNSDKELQEPEEQETNDNQLEEPLTNKIQNDINQQDETQVEELQNDQVQQGESQVEENKTSEDQQEESQDEELETEEQPQTEKVASLDEGTKSEINENISNEDLTEEDKTEPEQPVLEDNVTGENENIQPTVIVDQNGTNEEQINENEEVTKEEKEKQTKEESEENDFQRSGSYSELSDDVFLPDTSNPLEKPLSTNGIGNEEVENNVEESDDLTSVTEGASDLIGSEQNQEEPVATASSDFLRSSGEFHDMIVVIPQDSINLSEGEPDIRTEEDISEAEKSEAKEDTEGEAAAATRIQASYRGYRARKRMRKMPTVTSEGVEVNDDTPVENNGGVELNLEENDDEKQAVAATRIQASFRGYKTRKELKTNPSRSDSAQSASQDSALSVSQDSAQTEIDKTDEAMNQAATKIQASARGYIERKKINRSHQAATKIQANYRGYKTRKNLKNPKTENQ